MYKCRAGKAKHSRTPKGLRSLTFPPRGTSTDGKLASWISGTHHRDDSDAVLEDLGREGLHNLARRLRLHHHDLAEDLSLGHLLSRQLRQAVDHLGAHPC